MDLCLPGPCQNGATCVNLGNDYHCTCLQEFDVCKHTQTLDCIIFGIAYIVAT